MTEEPKQCIALTKSGSQCKNKAAAGSDYCGKHKNVNAEASSRVEASPDAAQMQELLVELRALVKALEASVAQQSAERGRRFRLRDRLKRRVTRLAPDSVVELVEDLRSGFQGTTKEDLMDPDTWRGLWYMITYIAASESEPYRKQLAEILDSFPGGDAVAAKVYTEEDDDDDDDDIAEEVVAEAAETA